MKCSGRSCCKPNHRKPNAKDTQHGVLLSVLNARANPETNPGHHSRTTNTNPTQRRPSMMHHALESVIAASLDTREPQKLVNALMQGLSDYQYSKDAQKALQYMLEAYQRMLSTLPDIETSIRLAVRLIARRVPKDQYQSRKLALELNNATRCLLELKERLQKRVLDNLS
jgi:hypothetical protein